MCHEPYSGVAPGGLRRGSSRQAKGLSFHEYESSDHELLARPEASAAANAKYASRLSEPRPVRDYDVAWSALAAHVGDLAVLALALGELDAVSFPIVRRRVSTRAPQSARRPACRRDARVSPWRPALGSRRSRRKARRRRPRGSLRSCRRS